MTWETQLGHRERPADTAPTPRATGDAVERARKYIARMPEAIQGSGGSTHCFNVARKLADFGLGRAEIVGVLLHDYNPRCSPPWSKRELEHKAQQAIEKRRPRPVADQPRRSNGGRSHAPGAAPPDDGWGDAEPSDLDWGDSDGPSDTRPTIDVGGALSDVVDQAIAALAKREVYQRSGALVDVIRTADVDSDGEVLPEGTPRLRIFGTPRLRELLDQAARFIRRKKAKDGSVTNHEILPPAEIVATLAARGEWAHIRPIVSVADWPLLRRDGSVCSTPGYDAATKTLCAVDVEIHVPVEPTRDDARAALDRLLDVVADFPFADDASRTAWLAALLTLPARAAIDGPVPLVLFEAPERGTGKSLLADTIVMLCRGRCAPRRTAPKEPSEWDKAMLAIGLAGHPVILLDNVTQPLRSDALDAVLTGTEFQGRLLGKNEELTIPIRTLFLASMNNPAISSDLVRRSLSCRLEALTEHPERRTGFRHPDLLGHVEQHRGELLQDALTVLVAYIVAECPAVEMLPMGSYEQWSRVVRAPLVWLGMADPAMTQESLRQHSDSDHETIATLVTAWEAALACRSMTVRDLLSLLADDQLGPAEKRLRDALAVFTDADPGKLPTARRTGNRLRSLRGKLVRGILFEARPGKGEHGTAWRTRRVNPDSHDSADSDSQPSRESDLGDGCMAGAGKHSHESHESQPEGVR